MRVVADMLSVLLAAIVLASATLDFRGTPQITELIKRLGYRPGFERLLGLVKIAGALGLLIGLAVPLLGELAAACFVAYFLLAVRGHWKAGDTRQDTAPAVMLAGLSAVTLLLGILS